MGSSRSVRLRRQWVLRWLRLSLQRIRLPSAAMATLRWLWLLAATADTASAAIGSYGNRYSGYGGNGSYGNRVLRLGGNGSAAMGPAAKKAAMGITAIGTAATAAIGITAIGYSGGNRSCSGNGSSGERYDGGHRRHHYYDGY